MKKIMLLCMMLVTAVFADIKIITDRSDLHYEFLKSEFEAKTGIKLNILAVKEGLAERLQSEKFDVVYSTDSLLLESIKDRFVDIGTNHRIHSTNKYLTVSGRTRGFFTKVGLEAPSTFFDLMDEDEYIGKVCVRKLTHSYNIDLFTQLAMHYGIDNTKVFINWLKENTAKGINPSGNDRSQVKSIKDGVCEFSIGNSYYMEVMKHDEEQKSWADAVTFSTTTENILLTSGVGAVAYNDEIATLLAFIESKEFQDKLAISTYEITNIKTLKYSNKDLLDMRKEIFNYFK